MSYKVIANWKLSFAIISVVFILAGCSSRLTNIHQVTLDNQVIYMLQPIPENLKDTGIQALFKVKQPNSDKKFLMQVEMTSSHLLMSAMTIEGLSLFTLDWNIALNTLDYDKKAIIEPQRVLAELQLVLWPTHDVVRGLVSGNLTTAQQTREVSIDETLVYRINKRNHISELTNLKQHYSIIIEELERWPLSADK